MRRAGLRYYARCGLQMKRKGGPEGSNYGLKRGGKSGQKRGGSAYGESDAGEGSWQLPTGFLTLLASRQKSTAYKCATCNQWQDAQRISSPDVNMCYICSKNAHECHVSMYVICRDSRSTVPLGAGPPAKLPAEKDMRAWQNLVAYPWPLLMREELERCCYAIELPVRPTTLTR